MIVGRIDKELKDDLEKNRSFELHRNSISSNISIITFDELYAQFMSFNKMYEI